MTEKEKIKSIIELFIAWNGETEVIDIANLDSAVDFIIDSLQEEPVSIDFEQELYKAFGQVKDFTLGMRIAKWFYDMGKNSQEPVSDDLEKELSAYVNSEEYLNNIGTSGLLLIARHFAWWQKQQMMKNAVDIIPFNINPNSDTAYFWIEEKYGKYLMIKSSWITSRGIEINKRVKLIIIKED